MLIDKSKKPLRLGSNNKDEIIAWNRGFTDASNNSEVRMDGWLLKQVRKCLAR